MAIDAGATAVMPTAPSDEPAVRTLAMHAEVARGTREHRAWRGVIPGASTGTHGGDAS